jgi:hypothetical protein
MLDNFNTAVRLIVDDYANECATQRCTLKELFKAYMMTDGDIKNEFLHILQHSCLDPMCFDDSCNITNANGTEKTFRQLKTAVLNSSELRKEF